MLAFLLATALAGPAEDSPSGYAQAHADIAHVLGYVSVHCPVGAEVDGRLVGMFSQRIHNGWYSNVETRLAGTHVIETQVGHNEKGRPEYETKLRVSWSATEAGQAVRCTIEPITWVPVTVIVRDSEGQPVAGAHVFGCGVDGDTGLDGVLRTKARDHASCTVRTHHDRVRYTAAFDPAADAGTGLHLRPTPREPSDYDPMAEVPESRSVLEVYEGLAPTASSPQAEGLFRHLIDHRRGMIDLRLCHAGDAEMCARLKPILGHKPAPLSR